MARLVIFGAGGCGGDLLRAATYCYADVVFADDNPRGAEYFGRPLIRAEQMRDSDHFTPAVGDGAGRARLIERFAYVRVEDFATIGFSATVRSNGRRPLRIGRAAKVGCGAMVMKSVPDGATVAGNPARPLREYVRAAG